MNRRSLSAEALNTSEAPVRKNRRFSSKSLTYDRWTIICLIIGSLNVLNGLWMLIAPEHWYYNLPAGVPEFGPLNVHFIRDIGCIFFLIGVGNFIAAFYIQYRIALFTVATGFYVLHMLVHVFEVVSGRIRLSMFWVDLPGVYIPTILFCILNVFMIKQHRNQSITQIIRN